MNEVEKELKLTSSEKKDKIHSNTKKTADYFTNNEQCNKKNLELAFENLILEAQTTEKENQELLKQKVKALGVKKNWNETQQASYILKLVMTDEMSASGQKKNNALTDLITKITNQSTSQDQKTDCKIYSDYLQELKNILSITENQWNTIIKQIEEQLK